MEDEKASAKNEKIAHPRIRGVDLLRDPLLNKVNLYKVEIVRKRVLK